MIDTLVIVVYNRYANLVKWFDILKHCVKPVNVVVIHNSVASDPLYKSLCESNGAIYISRNNTGYDIGAFQDVCYDRLPGFPDWKQLFWCTDDTFPMDKFFISYFALSPGEGVRCMEISYYVKPHIRTTGFSIAKEVAQRLTFPTDPVTTKQHCYLFEHRDLRNTFMQQIQRIKLAVTMVAPKEVSPLFDTGYHRREKRDKELNDKWNFEAGPIVEIKTDVTIICPIFNSFPAVISSLIMQTFKSWKLILIHDGPSDGAVKAYINAINDDRIEYIETENHAGNWGHSIRAEWLQKVKTEYVLITNPDNYYMPVFLEYAAKELSRNGAVAAYSQNMIHSYKAWQLIPCFIKRGYLDCGGVLLKTLPAQQAGWHNLTDHSADWFFFEGMVKMFGVTKFVPVKGTLFVHN